MSFLKWKSIPPMKERITTALKPSGMADRNCYGTALFLLGVLPHDVLVFTNNSNENMRKALEQMECIPSPRDSSIMVSYDKCNEIRHASFIFFTKPLKGIHRLGGECAYDKCPAVKFYSFDEIEDYLRSVQDEGEFTGPYAHRFFTAKEGDLEEWARKMVERYSPGWWM